MVLYVRGSHQKNLQCSIHRYSKVSAKPINYNNISVSYKIKFMSFHYQIFALGTVVYSRHYALLITFFFPRSRFPQDALHEAVVLGRRYTAEEAKESKMVDEVCPMSQLEERALAAANKLAGKEGLDRRTLAAIKSDLYRDTVAALNEPVRFYSRL